MDAPLDQLAAPATAPGAHATPRAADLASRHAVLYPNLYAWYVLASTLDIIVTNTIIHRFGGWEVNHLADLLIESYGTWGLIALKYSTVLLVVVICETIGRRSPRAGRNLALAATIVSAMPVGVGLLQVYAWVRSMI